MAEKMTPTTRTYINQMAAVMQRLEWDIHHPVARDGRVPPAWKEIWQNRTQKKARISLWVDADVVKFFKSLGPGYGPKMNAVLRAFMLSRLAGLLEGDDLLESARETWMGQKKPQLHEMMAEMERLSRMARGEASS